jgi:hypothetical protein
VLSRIFRLLLSVNISNHVRQISKPAQWQIIKGGATKAMPLTPIISMVDMEALKARFVPRIAVGRTCFSVRFETPGAQPDLILL